MTYKNYIKEIKERKALSLHPKPIDEAALLKEIISQIKDINHISRNESIKFLIYNVIPGTTSAANVKAKFLKEIINNDYYLEEINTEFAFELLSHMKGGPSTKVLLDLALSKNNPNAEKAASILKTQVFLYESDTDILETAFNNGNLIAKEIIESYSQAEFFTKLPEIDEEIKVVTFVAGQGDISTDLLSPGGDAHSRSDRELHGKCMFEHNINQQKELVELQKKHPDKTIMLIAEKGTMGVGSSRMSGVNNVALWIGKKASPYVPFVNIAPIVAGTNGISPIFLTTVDVTGGIGLDLKNWVKSKDKKGNIIIDNDGEAILNEKFSVKTGTILTINTKNKKLYNADKELCDISASFTPQKN
jgi:aconitate hydratase 2/2-methylisocitrate dehydratase